jgi:hypothetical protein
MACRVELRQLTNDQNTLRRQLEQQDVPDAIAPLFEQFRLETNGVRALRQLETALSHQITLGEVQLATYGVLDGLQVSSEALAAAMRQYSTEDVRKLHASVDQSANSFREAISQLTQIRMTAQLGTGGEPAVVIREIPVQERQELIRAVMEGPSPPRSLPAPPLPSPALLGNPGNEKALQRVQHDGEKSS